MRMILARSVHGLNLGNSLISITPNCTHGCLVPGNGTIHAAPNILGRIRHQHRTLHRQRVRVGRRTRTAGATLSAVKVFAVRGPINRGRTVFNAMATTSMTSIVGSLTTGRISQHSVAIPSVGQLNRCRTRVGLRPSIITAIGLHMVTR